jgi:hypothetical protein
MEKENEENEDLIYTLSDLADSYVNKDIESMDEWMTMMSDEELAIFHRMCNQDPLSRSDKDNYEISKFALILYCRELGLKELAITDDLMGKITGYFGVNIIVESLRRKGFATTEGPLFLYKETRITLTGKGKEYLKGVPPEDGEDEKSEEK